MDIEDFPFSKNIIKLLYKDFFKDTFEIQKKPPSSFETILELDIKSLYNEKNKFDFLRNKIKYSVLHDKYIEYFFSEFYKLQRIHNGFKKLIRIFLFKKANQYNDYNLLLEEIPDTKKHYITIIEQKTKYTFGINELAKIIYNSLTYHDEFFIDSKPIKNPYTNISISKCNLYNFYIFLLHNHISPHELFHGFYKNEFCINPFIMTYQVMIKDYIIINETNTMILSKAVYYLENMLNDYANIVLHSEFERARLIVFDKYLYNYLYTLYGLNDVKKRSFKRSLRLHFKAFKILNPQYGRKIYSMNNVFEKSKSKIIYDVRPYNIPIVDTD